MLDFPDVFLLLIYVRPGPQRTCVMICAKRDLSPLILIVQRPFPAVCHPPTVVCKLKRVMACAPL